ncbi:hypothetical protein PW52_05145 [Tamlana sedimentorum]|uniref:Uncharacterized protein n=1 Tax=Neotamlana sedimentorum TaxID=1435349 RepID=A0A0D7WE33_9FLAO|nr:hypothetical protein [Tamlana sedimentorum]KJD36007.1 hypothetical protein PW52_05145 [Tamlana sedimentorum]
MISEDNGNDGFVYNLITSNDTITLNASGEIGKMTKKQQEENLIINRAGIQKLIIYPKVPASKATKSSYKFKGLELIPVK